MNHEALQTFMKREKEEIDHVLTDYISGLSVHDGLKDAMLYSLQAGGKRVRPILLLATLADFARKNDAALSVAAAVEMIHTYSLIHDDLPAMDDDDLRRGKPTNHKAYGESTAVLAGDALLTYSFQLIADIPETLLSSDQKLTMIRQLAKASGPEGMITGQMLDIEAEQQAVGLAALEDIHIHKTGQLLAFSVQAGALLAEATDEQMAQLQQFSHHIGLAFQIRDDILDVEGDQEAIGKNIGSDQALHKSTYPALLTLQGAKERLSYHVQEAQSSLEDIQLHNGYLEMLADYIAHRSH